LKNGEIELLNRVELLEAFHSRLNEQGRNNESIKSLIENANKRSLGQVKDLVGFLNWFHNSTLTQEETIEESHFEGKFIVSEREGKFLNFGDQLMVDFVPGKTYKKYWINLENGLITNYSTIQYDSLESNSFSYRYRNYKWRANETNFRLLYSQKIPPNKLFVSGKIEEPLSKKVHIKILDSPFGTELKTKTVLLDSKGAFKTNLDYSHGGFVYVENENKNKHKPPGTYVFYAEPGDSILFESTGKSLPWNTEVAGTRVNEAKLIQKLRKEIDLFKDQRRLSGTSNLILDKDYFTGVSFTDGKVKIDADIDFLFQAFEKAKSIISGYKNKISEKAFGFIKNEITNYFYHGAFNVGSTLINSELFYDEMNADKEVLSRIDDINIHLTYNDFGLHSRKCVNQYLFFHFQKAKKVDFRVVTSYNGFIYFKNREMKIQFARMVLAGSPLYREIAAGLRGIVLKHPLNRLAVRNDLAESMALEKMDLIIRRCNDLEVVGEIEQILLQHEKLQRENYLPKMNFKTLQKETVSFYDFRGEKPTVFYLSSNWIGDRYQYDNAAKAMPEINYVMVVEGSNFEQWKEYTKRAEPIATHLFYSNDSTSFTDLFHQPNVYLVFNKDGEFVDYARDARDAARKAKESLNPPKKQPDKSQLLLIIYVLGGILILFIIGLIIWKWRVRQRFRKEEQRRRLRELELTAIRSQMNPHFLFNSLNSVQNLVQQNKGREAHLYLSDFAGLIRKVLQNSEKEEVSLNEELETVQQYLNLEKLRFDFEYSVKVEEGIDANNTMVPSMLLQPFAENAVIHGLQNKPKNGQLKIEVKKVAGESVQTRLAVSNRLAHSNNSGIIITIQDNGIGRHAANELSKQKNGKSSKLLKERLNILQQKQGEKYELNIIDLNGNTTGTRVEILVPEEK